MKFTFPNILFVILIGILTAWLTFLTTKGGLTNNTHKSLIKKLTKRGKIVLFVLVAITLLLIGQEINNNNQNHNKNLELVNERDSRDLKITEGIKLGVDSISQKLFEDISVAFSKQELQLDTLNQVIIKINKKPLISNVQLDPVIRIASNGITKKDSIGPLKKYDIKLNIEDAGATNFNIKCTILDCYTDNTYSMTIENIFPTNLKLRKNGGWEIGYSLLTSKTSKTIYFYLEGTYTSLDGLKSYSINDLYQYNQENNKVTMPLNKLKSEILAIISKMSTNQLKN